jgi:asparagine synthase (glutamine-hydrolysing)
MCGIYGMIALGGEPLRRPGAADTLASALRHRGPDGHGRVTWPDAVVGVTRLRVVDLDPRADQPFTDATGSVTLCCNGEIYNAPELRRRFPGHAFQSASDVEVILPLYLERGPAGLAELDGMFALAVLDRRRGMLVLARDRSGEKPLFTCAPAGELWFASEIGALLSADGVPRKANGRALDELLRLGYVSEPRTPFTCIRKVPAGTIVTFRNGSVDTLSYWDPVAAVGPAPSPTVVLERLRAGVARQVRADVPIGVFTSGGLDSALLARLAVDLLGAARVRTFAVGFPDRSYDERRFAERLSAALGTTHLSVEVSDEEVPEALETLVATGEPITDPAAVPTLLLARRCRPYATVVLTGEGADELFGGYPTYIGHRLVPTWRRLPTGLRAAIRRLVMALPASQRRVTLEFLLKRFVTGADMPWPERHLAWFGTGLPGVMRDHPPRAADAGPEDPADVVAAAMRFDYSSSLRERLLVKIDRAAMRAALETRAPYLDPAVIRAGLAAGGAQVGAFSTKRLLRRVAAPLVPPFILRRRKRGLSVPVSRWLNGPLAASADRWLRPRPSAGPALVPADTAADLLRAHRAGRADHGRALWTLMVIQHWLTHWNVEVE